MRIARSHQIGAAAIAAALSVAPCAGQTLDSAVGQRPGFRVFRFDEDWSALRSESLRTMPLDGLKYISLNDADPAAYLSINGEARTRYDTFWNPGFGLRGLDRDDYLLQRFLLGADLHLSERLRVFAQLVSGFQVDPESTPSPQQDDALDLQQAFADVRLGDDPHSSLTVRAGRMEMGFGSSRLVSPRDPTNVRLNFDGVRLTAALEGATIDAFLTRPVEQERGVFNDGANDAQTFWGIYGVIPLTADKRMNLDLYYLGLRRENVRFGAGVGTDERHSVGGRWWGGADDLDYDVEGVLQFGEFSGRDIRAWTLASNTGYTWRNAPWKPRVGLKANIASGDTDPTDGTQGTFYALFPKQSYFSELNLLAPSNFFDIHPTLQFKPGDRVTVNASWDPFWRYTTKDAVYGPGRIAIAAGASNKRYVGSTIDVQVDWAITGQLTLTGYYGHFFSGDVVNDASGRDTDYAGVWLTFKF